MENIVLNRQYEPLPPRLLRFLPPALVDELEQFDGIEELRLSGERRSFVRISGKNLPLSVRLTQEQLDTVFMAMCDGSLYAHAETLREGYLSLGDGLRVGVAGRAVVDGGKVSGIFDIRSLSVRIPHAVFPDVSRALSVMARSDGSRGILVYAPPGGGKTSFLRSCAVALSSGETPRRVVVVDTRDELSFGLESAALCLDILVGYPKAYGIEIATRVLGAQIIVCDEIGDEREADAILGVQSGGVALVASAHACAVTELLRRPTMARLHRAGIFGAYVRPEREGEAVITEAEKIDADL